MPRRKEPSQDIDKRLDDAVEETFPASDPIAVSTLEQKGPDGKPTPPKRTGAAPFEDPARKARDDTDGPPPPPSPS